MTRPWVAVDATIRVNHKLVALPHDSARWGWICLLGEAKQQRPAGAFRSEHHLMEAAGRFGRYVQAYCESGLVEVSPALCERCDKRWSGAAPGMFVIHDWHLHQRDPGSAQRSENWRANADRTQTERTSDARPNDFPAFVDTVPSRALSLSMSTSTSEPRLRDVYQVGIPEKSNGASSDTFDVMLLVEGLTRRPFSFHEGSQVHDTLVGDVAAHGASRMSDEYRAFREAASGPVDAAQLVFGVHNALHPLTRTRTLTAAEAKEKEIADAVAYLSDLSNPMPGTVR